MVEKCDFLKVVKTPYSKNRFLVNLRPFIPTYKFFSRSGWFFPVKTLQWEYFNEKISSLAGLKKKLFGFPQKYRFWPILITWVRIEIQFSQRRGKISKNPWSVYWTKLLGTLC